MKRLLICLSFIACADHKPSALDASALRDASPLEDAAPPDAQPSATDAVVDAGLPDALTPDVSNDSGFVDAGGVSSEDPCSFNQDCISSERCECDEATGCFCRLGMRGLGQTGVDPCETGNDCASALCVEGPGGAFVCSGPCSTVAECGGLLPVCADIAFVGRICIRTPGS